MDAPVVPICINGLGGVPILAQRARALRDAVRAILDEVAGQRRVLLLSSGAISVDIGSPRSWPGGVFAVPDPDWAQPAATLIAAGDLDTLVAAATPERFADAGNASAELLDVIRSWAHWADHRRPTSPSCSRPPGTCTRHGGHDSFTMPPFDVNHICWRIVHEPEFYRAVLDDPASALRGTGVSDDDRETLLGGDVQRLYERGANPFLMEHLANCRVFGLDTPKYRERISRAEWRPA